MSKETNITEEQTVEHKPFFQIIAARLNAVSPFDFGTLKEVPLRFSVVLTLLCTALCFGGIWHWYERNIDMSAFVNGASFPFFVKEERADPSRHTRILIGGTSANGMGIHRNLFEKRMECHIGNASVGSCYLWEFERILKKYPKETEDVRVVTMEIPSTMFAWTPSQGHWRGGDAFHFLKDVTDFSSKNLKLIAELKKNKTIKHHKSAILLPLRFSIKQVIHFIRHKTDNDFFEGLWRDSAFMKGRKPIQDKLIEQTSEPRPIPTVQSNMIFHKDVEQSVFDFIQYCESRGIFVVFNIPPRWRYFTDIPEAEILGPGEHQYLALLQELDRHPNCKVFTLKNFQMLIPNAIDSKYLFDRVHMTEEGAAIYTNWLADQMLKDPKVVAALKTPRRPEEFFVKKWLKPIVKPVYLYVKNGIKSQREEHKKTPIFVVKDKPKPATSTETKTQTKTATTEKTVR